MKAFLGNLCMEVACLGSIFKERVPKWRLPVEASHIITKIMLLRQPIICGVRVIQIILAVRVVAIIATISHPFAVTLVGLLIKSVILLVIRDGV